VVVLTSRTVKYVASYGVFSMGYIIKVSFYFVSFAPYRVGMNERMMVFRCVVVAQKEMDTGNRG